MSDGVDAVFCWVDGSDIGWLRKKEENISCDYAVSHYREMNSEVRYSQFDEIFYAVHSVRKFAPWVRNIYLLTDQQIPAWLDKNKRNELGITMVDHRDVFKGFEDALPTFNSMSIESMLSRIPNLSERFLYLNDDVVFTAPVSLKDFFYEDGVVVRGRLRSRVKFIDNIYRKIDWLVHRGITQRGGYVGRLGKSVNLPGRWSYIELGHAPHALYKVDFNRVVDREFIKKNIYYKFRNKNQVSPVSYILNWSRAFRSVKLNSQDWRCLYSSDLSSMELMALFEYDGFEGVKFFCFNDLSALDRNKIDELHRMLDSRLGISLESCF